MLSSLQSAGEHVRWRSHCTGKSCPQRLGGHPLCSANTKDKPPGASGHQNTERAARSPRSKQNDMIKRACIVKKKKNSLTVNLNARKAHHTPQGSIYSLGNNDQERKAPSPPREHKMQTTINKQETQIAGEHIKMPNSASWIKRNFLPEKSQNFLNGQ